MFSRQAKPTWSEDLLLVLNRNLPREEGYYTFSYSALWNEAGRVGGIFCACYETTARVIGERRLGTLRDLEATATQAKTAQEACELTADALTGNRADVPFVLIYLLEDEARRARLVAARGLESVNKAAPGSIDLSGPAEPSSWPLRSCGPTTDR